MSSMTIKLPKNFKSDKNDQQHLEKLFKRAHIQLWKVVPIQVLSQIKESLSSTIWNRKVPYLPLEWFDAYPFEDFRTQFELLQDNLGEGDDVKGLAFLPKWNLETLENYMNRSNLSISSFETTNTNTTMTDFSTATHSIVGSHKSNIFSWTNVAVLSIDVDRQLVEVEDLVTEEILWIPSTYVKLSSQSAETFVDRIKCALNKRNEAEILMKYQLTLDCLPLESGNNQKLPKKLINKIIKILGKDSQLRIQTFIMEVEREYQLKHNEMDLWMHLDNFQHIAPYLVLPSQPPFKPIPWSQKQIKVDLKISKKIRYFNWLQIYTFPEVYNCMQFILDSCRKLGETPLFFIGDDQPIELTIFNQKQEEHVSEVINFLHDSPNQLVTVVKKRISVLGKGWFDVKLDSWDTFLISKIYRLLQLIRFHVQNAIRILIEASISSYCDWLCTPAGATLDIAENFEWGEDLITSPFHENDPVFHVTLKMTTVGTYFSTDPDQFEPSILRPYEEVLLDTHFIKIIDPLIMENLVYPDGLYYTSIGIIDPMIGDKRQLLIQSIRQNLIPLRAYAKRYDVFVGFFALDNVSYVEQFKNENHTMLEIKEEILLNIEMRQKLEETVPSSIVIGVFYVLVEPIRRFLIRKRTDMIDKLLLMLNEKITEKTLVIAKTYRDMYQRLIETSKTVEELFETQEWMEALPELVKNNENQMKLILFDYDILDFFEYALNDADVDLKWEALKWPNIILKRINVTREVHTQDLERFQKNQISDLAYFDSMVEGLNVQVAAYNLEYDSTKAIALAKKAKTIAKELEETFENGTALNNRQILLNLPELEQVIEIQETIKSFQPYQKLWISGESFYNQQNQWLETPLAKLKMTDLSKNLDMLKSTFKDLLPEFQELPKVQEVVKVFLREIDEYEAEINVAHLIKHHCWQEEQFIELKNRTELEIEYKKGMTLKDCLDANINDHYEVVQMILNDAIEEFNKLERLKKEKEEEERKYQEYLVMRKRRRDARTDI